MGKGSDNGDSICKQLERLWNMLTHRRSGSTVSQRMQKGCMFWVLSAIWLTGAAAALWFPIQFWKGEQGWVAEDDEPEWATHAEVGAIFAIFGVAAPVAWFYAFYRTCTYGSRVPPFECCYYVFVGMSPRCEHQMVDDGESFNKAKLQYADRQQQLQQQIQKEEKQSQLIHFSLQTDSSDQPTIEISAYPHCTVASLAAQLQLEDTTCITLAGGALRLESTLDSQGIVEATQLALSKTSEDYAASAEDVRQFPSALRVQSDLQLELTNLEAPQQDQHQKDSSTPVCCYWGGNLEAGILKEEVSAWGSLEEEETPQQQAAATLQNSTHNVTATPIVPVQTATSLVPVQTATPIEPEAQL